MVAARPKPPKNGILTTELHLICSRDIHLNLGFSFNKIKRIREKKMIVISPKRSHTGKMVAGSPKPPQMVSPSPVVSSGSGAVLGRGGRLPGGLPTRNLPPSWDTQAGI